MGIGLVGADSEDSIEEEDTCEQDGEVRRQHKQALQRVTSTKLLTIDPGKK